MCTDMLTHAHIPHEVAGNEVMEPMPQSMEIRASSHPFASGSKVSPFTVQH